MVGMIRQTLGDAIGLLCLVTAFLVALIFAPLVGAPYSIDEEYEVRK